MRESIPEKHMEPYLKKIVLEWYDKAVGPTVFDKFISLWISFNAWGASQSNEENDRGMLEWAKTFPALVQSFQTQSRKPKFTERKRQLQSLGPIPRHRKWKGSTEAKIDDISKWDQVLEEIYVIRCNLIHGRKSFHNLPDKLLVGHAYHLLEPVFRSVVSDLKHGM